MRSAKVWAGRVLACGHGREPLGPECEKVLHNWRRRRGRGQHGSGHDRKSRRNARACCERPGDHQQTLYQREQLHRQPACAPAPTRDGSRATSALSWRKFRALVAQDIIRKNFILNLIKSLKSRVQNAITEHHEATLISSGAYALLGSGGPRCNAWSCRCQGAPVRTVCAWCAQRARMRRNAHKVEVSVRMRSACTLCGSAPSSGSTRCTP